MRCLLLKELEMEKAHALAHFTYMYVMYTHLVFWLLALGSCALESSEFSKRRSTLHLHLSPKPLK